MPPKKEKAVSATEETKPEVTEHKITTVQKLRCRSNIYCVNPFTNDRFLPGEEVDATMDSWLDCQLQARIIEPCL